MRIQLFWSAAASALILAGCGQADPAANQAEIDQADIATDAPMVQAEAAPAETEAQVETMQITLADVVADPRRAERAARDGFRHPEETLTFFGLAPGMTVVEAWPGGGWYTDILGPYLQATGGKLIAAGFAPEGEYRTNAVNRFAENYVSNPEVYGDIDVTVLSAETDGVAADGSADMVLTFRNVHNWMFNDFGQKAFDDFYAALKPGGVLGVVEHRLPEEMDSVLQESSGYVKQSVVVAFAEAAGFEFIGASEVNANPADTADHPFGVWTLPPSSRTQARDGSVPEGFDPAPFLAIGESDRMTLKFVKPVLADGALLE